MVLWTIQELHIWEMIQATGVYRCDPAQTSMLELRFKEHYDWLVQKMTERIGPPPEGVTYPVWAWYQRDGKRSKPDLRGIRWDCAPGDYICIEIDVPDDQVVLSDYEIWHFPLLNSLIAETEEEAAIQEAYYESLTEDQKKAYRDWNWEQVFDVSPFENEWLRRGKWVQATFWELKKEQVRAVRFFTAGVCKER